MMPATKKKQQSAEGPQLDDSFNAIAEKSWQNETKIRQWLLELAAESDPRARIDQASYMILKRLGWEDIRIRREWGRAQNAVRDLQIAGSESDRKQLDKAAAEASQKFEVEGPEIDQQIAALQKERANLEQAAKRTARQSEQAYAAVDRLRSDAVLPDFVVDQLNASRRDGDIAAARKRIGDLEVEIKFLEVVLDEPQHGTHSLDNSYKMWLETVQRYDHSFVAGQPVEGTRQFHNRLTPAYRQARPQLEAKLKELSTELADAEREFEDSQSKTHQQFRDFWFRVAGH